MGQSFDLILTVGAIIIGILLLTGNGSFLLKGGMADNSRKQYDQKKMERASGIAMLLLGAATGIDMLTTGLVAEIIYLIAVILIFGGLVYYYTKKCKK